MTILGRGLGRGGGGGLFVAFGLGRNIAALKEAVEIIIDSSVEEFTEAVSSLSDLVQLTDTGITIVARVDRLNETQIGISVSASEESGIYALADISAIEEKSIVQAMLTLQDSGSNVEALIQKVDNDNTSSTNIDESTEPRVSSSISSDSDSIVGIAISKTPDSKSLTTSTVEGLDDDISSH
jgi:hypothetical protein